MKSKEKLAKMEELSAFSLPEYTALPEIDLYMDQVIGYLNRMLCKVCRSEDGMPITPNRINNYVKGGYLSRPTQKKYDREQIARLYMLCCAKQNLDIPSAAALLRTFGGVESLYADFKEKQETAVHAVAEEVLAVGGGEKALADKALELLLRSAAERFAAEEIIAALPDKPQPSGTQPKKKAEKPEKAAKPEKKEEKNTDKKGKKQ